MKPLVTTNSDKVEHMVALSVREIELASSYLDMMARLLAKKEDKLMQERARELIFLSRKLDEYLTDGFTRR